MAESITITEAETGPDAPVAEQDNSTRPEWLPEKFATVEDMAKSYGELEKKLSGPSEEPEAVEEAEAPKSEGPDFDKFAQQFASDGALSDESFSELEGMGYPREMVETYIKGMQSAQTADTDAVMSVAGGTEGYQELTEWAKANMETNELELYNNMVGTGTDNAKMAVEWLMSKREAVGGVEPTLLSGKSAAPAKDEFRSTAEVVAAMKDARYGKDSAYTKDVEEKLGRSSVF
jgi:hypothetical protein